MLRTVRGSHGTALRSRPLHLLFGTANTPHPDKKGKGGEDAFFADPAIGAFGVADGVGGSARQGVDPGIFSRMMLSLCHRHLAENAVEPPSPAHLTRAMEASGTALARNPIGGSSTVLLGQLSNLTQSLTLPLTLTLTLSRCSSASSTARPRSSPWSTSAIRRR